MPRIKTRRLVLAAIGVLALACGLACGGAARTRPGPSGQSETKESAVETSDDSSDTQTPPSVAEHQAPSDDVPRTPLDGDAAIIIGVTELASHRIKIHCATNFPAGTVLMLSVRELSQGGFYGQSRGSVRDDGSLESAAFGPQDGLGEGLYMADVVMPVPRSQPDHVRKLLGPDGEHLSGPLVKKDQQGVSVSAKHGFTIGGSEARKLQQAREDRRLGQYRNWLKTIIALERRLKKMSSQNLLANKNDTAKTAMWFRFAQQFNKDHQAYQEKLSEVQPALARLVIAAALSDIRQMFNATAFQKADDYGAAAKQYVRSLRDLRKLAAGNINAISGNDETESVGPDERPGTQRANKLLKLAKSQFENGKKAAARTWLSVILKEYPETEAAEDAQRLQQEWGQR